MLILISETVFLISKNWEGISDIKNYIVDLMKWAFLLVRMYFWYVRN